MIARDGKIDVHGFHLRAGINVRNNRITAGRIEVNRLPHHAIEIRYSISCLDREAFRHTPARGKQSAKVSFRQRPN